MDDSISAVWDAFTGYQRTAALKAAVELDVFALLAAGVDTVEALAARTQAAPRGIRALVDRLTMDGFLARTGDRYAPTPVSTAFLDPSSPSCIASGVRFIASPMILDCFARLTDAVRRGGTALPQEGTLAPEHPVWVDFARAMAPLAGMTGFLLGNLLDVAAAPPWKVLDVAAGHGMFGIALAQQNPGVTVTGLDWRNVLAVAEENARAAGVAARYRTIPGSAFDVPFGDGYDLVLMPNILHHFDPPGCERLLAKAHAALKPGGRVVIVEFVPDEDRTGPPDAVRFSLVMLATTPAGDAYTFGEYRTMLQRAGFGGTPTVQDLLPTPARVVIATR